MTQWRRAVLACAGLAALLLIPLPASGGVLWDLSAGLGYVAVVFALLLFLYPLRRRGLPHRRLISVTQHRRIGWLALILALLHALLLLVIEPLTGQYLLPSAPLYMLCGVVALIALAVLVPTGLKARRRLRSAARSTAKRTPLAGLTHATLSALLLGFLAAHVLGSGQLLDKPTKAVTVCALLALTLAWSVLQPRWQGLRTPWFPVAGSALGTVLVLLMLPAPIATSRLLEPVVARSAPLPLDFPHDKHRDVNCIVCHHDMADHTGAGSCISCHRESPAALKRSAEATFHVFCRDCHTRLATEGHKHGPTRSCAACHRPEQEIHPGPS